MISGCFSLPLLLASFLLFFSLLPANAPVQASIEAAPAQAATASVSSAATMPVLAIAASPRTDNQHTLQNLLDGVNQASSAGVRGTTMSWTWKTLEPSPGKYNFKDLDNGINYLGKVRGWSFELTIQIINTTDKETPDDLAKVAFDSPQMKERFHALFDAMLPHLDNHIKYLAIGNEVDVYLNAQHQWAAYRAFYDDAVSYVHQKAPWLLVGVTCTFAGTQTNPVDVTALNKSSDVFFLTYYPLTATFAVRSPDAPLTDFPKMVALAQGRPLILQEVGYPAAERLDSSEQKQAQFVTNVFTAWKQSEASIPFLAYFLLHDIPQKQCDQLAQYYGLPNNANFNAYLCTLGLRKADDTARAAWQAFADGAKTMGFNH